MLTRRGEVLLRRGIEGGPEVVEWNLDRGRVYITARLLTNAETLWSGVGWRYPGPRYFDVGVGHVLHIVGRPFVVVACNEVTGQYTAVAMDSAWLSWWWLGAQGRRALRWVWLVGRRLAARMRGRSQ